MFFKIKRLLGEGHRQAHEICAWLAVCNLSEITNEATDQQSSATLRTHGWLRRAGATYPVVISSIWVLIAGNDLRSHPVGCAYKCISPANRPVQLSAHTKINWGTKSKEKWSTINKEEKTLRCHSKHNNTALSTAQLFRQSHDTKSLYHSRRT